MVTIINSSRNVSRTVDYNEQKVKSGKAELLVARGFIKSVRNLSFADKLRQFHRYNSLNERVHVNTLHITLNFDPSDQLTKDTLTSIADRYMIAIGFGNQPFLVYQHFDAGHPHLHIVTTILQKDGRRLPIHNLGRNQSKAARKEIEIQFGLVKAERRSEVQSYHPHKVQKVIYGKNTTKRAISDVVQEVINHYLFSSFSEYNGVLKLFNVMADRGREGSKMFQWKGLLYRVLDNNGRSIGTPIKASEFYHRPTVSYLEQKFSENASLKQPHARRIKTEIDFALIKTVQYSFTSFLRELENNRISSIFQKNTEGGILGITFVDHKTKTAFDDHALGQSYQAQSILQRLMSKESVLKPSENIGLRTVRQFGSWNEMSFEDGVPAITRHLWPRQQVSLVTNPL